MAKQRTLVFIKYPHSTRGGDLLGIFSMLNKAGFSIEAMKTYQLASDCLCAVIREGKIIFPECLYLLDQKTEVKIAA